MSEKEPKRKPRRAKPDDLSKTGKQADVELNENELKRVTGGTHKHLAGVKYEN